MRRIGALGALAVALLPFGGTDERPLPLHSPESALPALTALVWETSGSRLVRLDSSTFAPLKSSSRIGFYDGWVRSPDGKQVAVATHPYNTSREWPSTLRFADARTLKWSPRRIPLGGAFRGALWPNPGTLLALTTNDCCTLDLTLATIDVRAGAVRARQTVAGPVGTIARGTDSLVLLSHDRDAISPVRLTVVGADASIRTVRLERILSGILLPDASQVGDQQTPGLAVDPDGGVAYVVGGDGLVAAVSLTDLSVSYHRPATSLLARAVGWLTPAAAAKAVNGASRSARWLGDGLLAVTGSDGTAAKNADGTITFEYRPAGLQIVDTRSWSIRTINSGADWIAVADGMLLTTGGTTRSDGSSTVYAGEGLAAFGADGLLRWRIGEGQRSSLLGAYGSRAFVGKSSGHGYEILDVRTGRMIRSVGGGSFPLLLLGSGR
jgi:hypothetical protein